MSKKMVKTWTRYILAVLCSGLILACGDKNKTEAAEFFERGNYHFKKNETERALELFTEAIEKVPDFADAYNNRGLCYEKLENIAKASSDYREAVELDDSFVAAKLNLASAYIQTGELKSSKSLLEQLAPIYADSASFYELRGKYYLQSYEPEAAVADFKMALKMIPNKAETLTNLGFAYYQQKAYHKAETQFLKVLKSNPSFPFALNNLSATYAQMDQWKDALSFSNRAIAEVPNEVNFLNTHTLNLIENNLFIEAKEYTERSLKLSPENPYTLRNSGILKSNSENLEDGIKTLEEVESSNPEVEFLYYYLGRLYQRLGNTPQACKAYKRGTLLGDDRSKKASLGCQ